MSLLIVFVLGLLAAISYMPPVRGYISAGMKRLVLDVQADGFDRDTLSSTGFVRIMLSAVGFVCVAGATGAVIAWLGAIAASVYLIHKEFSITHIVAAVVWFISTLLVGMFEWWVVLIIIVVGSGLLLNYGSGLMKKVLEQLAPYVPKT